MSGVIRDLNLPPGFRFHPTDDELVTHYLCRKCSGKPLAVLIVADIDLYKCDPWLLPGMALYGEKEWYFFSPRDRKYPNGSRPNRAAGSGYWKATGADKPIGSPKPVAIKKALVFYAGRAPKGEKTNWIMHEYRLADVDRSAGRKTNNLRLDDWVLCRIYNKKGGGGAEKPRKDIARAAPASEQKPVVARPHVPLQQQQQQQFAPQQLVDLVYLDTSDSMPRLHPESSCSEHVASPEFAPPSDREVQSRPRWREWERALDFQLHRSSGGSGGATAAAADGGITQFGGAPITSGFRAPLDDIFMHLQKPF